MATNDRQATLHRRLTMVPTNSLSDDMNFMTSELRTSGFEEDRQVANEAEDVLARIIKMLLPVLPYIDNLLPAGDRGIVVTSDSEGSKWELILDRKGEWSSRLCG